jgi:Dyp-type peroxidase family
MPINQFDPKFDSLLEGLQGNILKSHGRDHTANVFVTFDDGQVSGARNWIRNFALTSLTSARQQLAEIDNFKRHKVPGGIFFGLYVTSFAYDYFKIPPEMRPIESAGAFKGGMRNAQLNDIVSDWDPHFRGENIHLMVLVGHDDKEVLSKEVAKLIETIREFTIDPELPENSSEWFASSRINIEYGNAIRNANGDGLEHFGYVDGISQPLFFDDEFKLANENSVPFTGDQLMWDPRAELELVLTADHSSAKTFGSFYVFRKLEQDVRRFKLAERQLANFIGLDEKDAELAGAMIVGRFEDGTPVTLLADDGMPGAGNANNFNYAGDTDGLKCPFHSHIRKTNPRGSGGSPEGVPFDPKQSLEFDKTVIKARRGIPNGQREVSTQFDCQPEQFPTGSGIGLLFQSFQSDIAKQFEFIQKSWANNSSFPFSNPAGNSGIDPIVGQSIKPADREYNWPSGHGLPGASARSFNSFVTMRGGEYFFAPSLTTLSTF